MVAFVNDSNYTSKESKLTLSVTRMAEFILVSKV